MTASHAPQPPKPSIPNELRRSCYRICYRMYPFRLPPNNLVTRLSVSLSGHNTSVAQNLLQSRQIPSPLEPLAGIGVKRPGFSGASVT